MEYLLFTLFLGSFLLGMYVSWRHYKPIVEEDIDVVI